MIPEMINWMIIFAIVMLFPPLVINFFTQGFLFKYLRVLASRGKLVLIRVVSVADSYFRAGRISDGMLMFDARHPEKKQRPRAISVSKGDTDRLLSVNYVEIDEDSNCVLRPDKSKVEGHDANKTDSLMKRIAMLPSLEDKKEFIVFLVIMLVILAAVAANGYFTYTIKQQMVEVAAKVGVL